MSYRFFIRLSDGQEVTRDVTSKTFLECLAVADNEAKFLGGVVIAWDPIK